MEQELWNVSDSGYTFLLPEQGTSLIERIKDELDQLYVDELVEQVGNSYYLSHDIAVTLTNYQRQTLTLPDIFPYTIFISCDNAMGSPAFRYSISYNIPKDVPDNLQITGSYIYIADDIQFMFNEAQYKAINIAMACNERVQHSNRRELNEICYQALAEIKKYAKKADIELDRYLSGENIIIPSSMTVSINPSGDDTYTITPVFLSRHEGKIWPIQDQKLYDMINRHRQINRLYTTHNEDGTRKRYVISEAIQNGVKEVKKYKNIDSKTAKTIVAAPQEVFDSPAFSFDLEWYGERVDAIREYFRKNLPYIKMVRGSWLPEEGSTLPLKEDIPELIVTADNAISIQEKIQTAQENNDTRIEVNGYTYEITPELQESVCHVLGSQEEKRDFTSDKTENKKPTILDIKDNLEELDYTAKNRQRKVLKPLPDIGLEALNDTISLFKHQKEGLSWMQECWEKGYRGVLLADDMGLGKTVQAFSFIASLKQCFKGNMESVLIVAPVSLLKNWRDEYKKFIKPHIFTDIIELYGNKVRKYRSFVLQSQTVLDVSSIQYNHIILTTYETLRQYQLSLGRIDWSVMILDEAQKIKNPTTMVSLATRAMKYDFGIALTGTPVENTWVDLWTIMDFVSPGRLRSLKEFYQVYEKPIEHIKEDSKALETLGKKLQQNLSPLFLRRLKTEYLDGLPKKRIIKLEKEMPPVQQKAYEQVIQEALQQKGKTNQQHILQTIAKLRDISLCPALGGITEYNLFNMNADKIIHTSARLEKTFEILDEIYKRKEKVLIFVTSRKMQMVLKEIIRHRYDIYVPTPINGGINSARRQDIVNKFNHAEGFGVLILSAEAGGVGFNITSANNVIHLSRCWNPAKEDQATDRVYRIGQTKDVNVYIPIAYNNGYDTGISFDEKLDQLLDHKRGLSESVLYPVGDSEKDGVELFGELLKNVSSEKEYKNTETQYWTIDDMALLEGAEFEQVICDLYNAMPDYEAEKTQDSRDNGTDVIVISKHKKKQNLLIQCKQTFRNKNMGAEGVEQVFCSIRHYEEERKCVFQGVVITNAPDFTTGAKTRARENNIKLISHDDLALLLEQYPIPKRFMWS